MARLSRLLRPSRGPKLSLVVVTHDMAREAPRTLLSLSSDHQLGVGETDYEVGVADNGSADPLSEATVAGFGPHFRLASPAPPSRSPAGAINRAVAETRADLVGVMIDGARIATPGVVRAALEAARAFERPLIATLGWHLGPGPQPETVPEGYDAAAEDSLLEDIGWPADGYRLFEIASLAASSAGGWFAPMAESNCLFLTREMFDELGGYDESFRSPGGGLVNLDFYARACRLPGSALVTLLGEGTFHQVHGGVMTNPTRPGGAHDSYRGYHEEYIRLRGGPFEVPERVPVYFGRVPPAALASIEASARRARSEPATAEARV